MNKEVIDLIGEIYLLSEGGRTNPIQQEYWGHGNVKGEERNDSCAIYLEVYPKV